MVNKKKNKKKGVDRFYNLSKDHKYYDDNSFFRVVPNFVIQWVKKKPNL
jgi:cyclophilin family peptidyl-prolyl cis-trans isomerase